MQRSRIRTIGLFVVVFVSLIVFISVVGAATRNSQQYPKSGGVNGIPVPTGASVPGIVAGVNAGQDAWVSGASRRAQPPAPVLVPTDTPLSQPSEPAGVGPGDYEVGPDIKPGKYKTKGPLVDDVYPNCYWERHKPGVDSFAGIIKNDNTQGPATVTVKQGEMFKTSGCQPWALVPS